MFNNPSIQSTFNQFNGNYFESIVGFGMLSSYNTTLYYLMDYPSKVHILNDEWKFISAKNFRSPHYMINIGNILYMTGWRNVWKLDQDLNILIEYNRGGNPAYHGISYNSSNGLIYVASWNLNAIQLFNLDLTLISSLSTKPLSPHSITESSNKLYVGTGKRIVLVFLNEKIINKFNGGDGNSVLLTSILLDQNDYMATACDNPTNKLYLFSPNGSFTGKSITTPPGPYYIGLDSKGRFMQFSRWQISIYS